MTRRRIAFLCLAAFVLAALVPWTIRSEHVVSALARQIKQSYGVALASNGKLTFTLLPVPQLVLSSVHLVSADGAVEAQAAQLRTQLRLLPLLEGRLRLHKVWLAQSRIFLTLGEEPAPSVSGTLARLRGLLGTEPGSRWAPRIDRFIVTEAEVNLRNASGHDLARLQRASLMLSSPEPGGEVDLTVSAEWNGEAMIASLDGFDLDAFRQGRPGRVVGEAAGRTGRLSLDGNVTWADGPSFAGKVRGQTPSLSRLCGWTGLGMDLATVERTASIEADGTIDLAKMELPRATLELGRDRLDGAVSLQFGARAKLQATLAGNSLDLGWLGDVVDPRGGDRLRADYDVRVSATSLALGSLRLREAAVSVQSTARGVEVSLARASFAGGSLRGRVSAALDGEARDIRALGWANGIDLERALGETAGTRGVSGTASGQFSVEIAGKRGAPFARHIRGRGSVQARDGELAGIIAGDGAARAPQGSLASELRSGKVRFGQASIALDFGEGRAEIGSGSIETATGRSSVSGRVDLETMTASLRLALQAQGASPLPSPVFLDLSGPLRRLTLGAMAPNGAP